MKKQYSKPGIIIEDFIIAQNIASCGAVAGGNSLGKPNHWTKTTCGWDMDGIIAFLEGTTICNYPVEEGTDFGGICYNNPGGGNSIFSS